MSKKIKATIEKNYHAISKFGVVSKGKKLTGDSIMADRFYRYNKAGDIIEEGLYLDNYYSYNRPLIINSSKYDKNGNQIEDMSFSVEEPIGAPIEKIVYVYDNQSRITEEKKYIATNQNAKQDNVETKIKDEFTLDEIRNYNYDSRGNLIEQNVLLKDGRITDRVIYKCNENGNRTEVLIYNKENCLDEKILGKFDELGLLIEEKHFDGKDLMQEKAQYKYDDKWNIIEEKYFDGDNSLHSLFQNVLDNKNNLLEMNVFDSAGQILRKEINEFDCENRIIKSEDYNSEGSLTRKELHKYDEHGNEVQILTYTFENDFELFRMDYEYDIFNNYIKTIEFVNEIPQSICVREIEYYD